MLEDIANYLHDIFEYEKYSDNPHMITVFSLIGIIVGGVLLIVFAINFPEVGLLVLMYVYLASAAINFTALIIYYRYHFDPYENKLTSRLTTLSIFGVFGLNMGPAMLFVISAIVSLIGNFCSALGSLGPKINSIFRKLNINE